MLGLEQYALGHHRGGSHGRTRIIRQAYFESPGYLPLLRRAYALWDTFPPAYAINRVGCLTLGRADSPVLVGAGRSAAEWGIAVETLTGPEIATRFPQFTPASDDVALFEPGAGFVRPEETLAFLSSRSKERGAELRPGERVLGWDVVAGGVEVRTSEGRYAAGRLVLAAGAWTPVIAPTLALRIRVEQRVMHFFAPRGDPAEFAPERMPTFLWDLGVGDSIYGFPLDGPEGVKVAFHDRGPVIDPDQPRPAVPPAEVEAIRQILRERLPHLPDRLIRSVPCLYDLTPDHHFALGLAPGLDDRVVVGAGFSGHGFKFVPVIGEILADLATDSTSDFDLDFLSLTRFADPS